MTRAFGFQRNVVRHGACEKAAPFWSSENPRVKIKDRRDRGVRRELPFNSFWMSDVDVWTGRGDAGPRATVRAHIEEVRMPARRVQP